MDGYPINLKPLAVQEYNDVAYFISYNKDNNEVEYGMFPSIDQNAGWRSCTFKTFLLWCDAHYFLLVLLFFGQGFIPLPFFRGNS